LLQASVVKSKAVFLTDAIKMAIAASMRMNAEGIKVLISGRLNGAEMARSEGFKEGRVPYQLSEPRY
jgi:ribosomal protein S3